MQSSSPRPRLRASSCAATKEEHVNSETGQGQQSAGPARLPAFFGDANPVQRVEIGAELLVAGRKLVRLKNERHDVAIALWRQAVGTVGRHQLADLLEQLPHARIVPLKREAFFDEARRRTVAAEVRLV